jgi:nicotinamide riboside transporter PnuC
MRRTVSRLKRRVRTSDRVILLVTLLLALGSAFAMAHFGMTQKWHAAACWTLVPFSAVVPMYRRYWSRWRFWAALTIRFVAHIALMWIIFARMLASIKQMGTLYVIPFEFVEGFVLLLAVTILMRALGLKDKWIRI